MRADRNRRQTTGRTLPARLGLIAVAMWLVLASIAKADSQSALATGHCRHLAAPNEPCLGPIESVYTYEDSFSEGAISLMKATFGPSHPLDATHPFIEQRSVSWHAGRGVRIVAVFVVTRTRAPKLVFHFKRVLHTNHVVLTMSRSAVAEPPMLLIQGERIEGSRTASAMVASKRCVSYVREAPCIGPIQALYPMTGRDGGALRLLPAKLGPEVEVGKEPNGEPIMSRNVSWRSAAGVTLVAAYVMAPIVKDGKAAFSFHRIPTGARSGHVTLKAANNETVEDAPTSVSDLFILLEGRR
jgi:hypothetical protein